MGVVSSLSSVPDVRSRSIAIDVTRNMQSSGNRPRIGPPMRSNVSVPENTYLRIVVSAHGATSSNAMVRLSWRNCWRTRCAVAVR